MLMRIKSKTQDSDDKIWEKMIIYAFRQVFHDSAVLYQDGKEQYNGTKYEFDLQNIRNLTKNKHDGFENDIYCDKPLISKTNGNVFLLFYFFSYTSKTSAEPPLRLRLTKLYHLFIAVSIGL